jgi:hypothetical protein
MNHKSQQSSAQPPVKIHLKNFQPNRQHSLVQTFKASQHHGPQTFKRFQHHLQLIFKAFQHS